MKVPLLDLKPQYQELKADEIEIDSSQLSITECVNHVIRYLEAHEWLKN